MIRNYGVGTRDLYQAGRRFLERSRNAGGLSYSSVSTHAERWRIFAKFAKENGISTLEKIDKEIVVKYGEHLKIRIENEEISVSTAQNHISSINSVMRATPAIWTSVAPRGELRLPARHFVRVVAPASLDAGRLDAARATLSERGDAIVGLARQLGLRAKEASLLDAKAALRQAQGRGVVAISRGTKGGRVREVPITSPRQIEALQRAAKAQGNNGCLVPGGVSYRQWRYDELREIRQAVKAHTGQGLHDLRASYACDRYRQLTGHDAPVVAGRMVASRAADLAARQVIARELGHGRIDITGAYLGGR